MTEHNRMTEEQLEEKIGLVIQKYLDGLIFPEIARQAIIGYAKKFAIQVATEAVEEDRKVLDKIPQIETHKEIRIGTHDRILKNIKKRLNDE